MQKQNLSVVEALASLNVGPGKFRFQSFMSELILDLPSSHLSLSDGGNIMGARRAASSSFNSLECKSWLRQEEGGALSIPSKHFGTNHHRMKRAKWSNIFYSGGIC